MPKSNNKGGIYVGVDPGMKGGLVCLNGKSVIAVVMPATERDVWDLINSFQVLSFGSVQAAVIEKVHSMPHQGVASSFKFGMGFGGLKMALTAAEIPWEEVDPRKWQKALGIPPKRANEEKTQFKNRLKGFAQRLFPGVEVSLATADALLIALYCKRKHEGTL